MSVSIREDDLQISMKLFSLIKPSKPLRMLDILHMLCLNILQTCFPKILTVVCRRAENIPCKSILLLVQQQYSASVHGWSVICKIKEGQRKIKLVWNKLLVLVISLHTTKIRPVIDIPAILVIWISSKMDLIPFLYLVLFENVDPNARFKI